MGTHYVGGKLVVVGPLHPDYRFMSPEAIIADLAKRLRDLDVAAARLKQIDDDAKSLHAQYDEQRRFLVRYNAVAMQDDPPHIANYKPE